MCIATSQLLLCEDKCIDLCVDRDYDEFLKCSDDCLRICVDVS
ncbi:MAG: hypothetical protein QXH99_01160 [Sulfolobales archaeon]